MINGPAVYREILELIKPVFPRAIIAGGACRDFYRKGNNYSTKDIDIFVDVEDELSFEMKYYELKDNPLFSERYSLEYGKSYAGYEKNSEETENQFIGLFQGHPLIRADAKIEVIGKNFNDNFNYQSLVDSFDFDICKAYYDTENNTIVRTPEFIEALENRVIGPVKSKKDYRRAYRLKTTFDYRLKEENRWTIDDRREPVEVKYPWVSKNPVGWAEEARPF